MAHQVRKLTVCTLYIFTYLYRAQYNEQSTCIVQPALHAPSRSLMSAGERGRMSVRVAASKQPFGASVGAGRPWKWVARYEDGRATWLSRRGGPRGGREPPRRTSPLHERSTQCASVMRSLAVPEWAHSSHGVPASRHRPVLGRDKESGAPAPPPVAPSDCVPVCV